MAVQAMTWAWDWIFTGDNGYTVSKQYNFAPSNALAQTSLSTAPLRDPHRWVLASMATDLNRTVPIITITSHLYITAVALSAISRLYTTPIWSV